MIRIKTPHLILAFVFFISIYKAQSQIILEPNFVDELVMGGWNQANGIVYDSTGQSYVWDLKGRIWVIDTNGNKLPNALLDIKDEVGNWRAHGLHGVCLDPNFRTNGYIYCYYAVDRYYLLNYGKPNYNSNSNTYYDASILRVSRFTANSNTNFSTIVPNSKLILIGETKKTGIPLLHVTHDGGTILFGSDGSLLVFTGDASDYSQNDAGSAPGTYWSQALNDSIIRTAENVGAFKSQLLNCLNGKILRIDPATGNGLASNPFYDTSNPRSPKSRVYALGLRQPYRCSLKPGTGSTNINDGNPGTLIVSEVGWSTWEGVWFVNKPGQNLGWPIFEGLNRVAAFQTPIYNSDAPNPLFGTGLCDKKFFSFQNLLVNSLDSNPSYPNPCDNAIQIPTTTQKYKWFAPIINYRHTIASTEVPLILGDSVQPVTLTNPLSNVAGNQFAGNASMAGPWYNGANFPNSYHNTYFNFDYGSQWIKNFKLDSNNKVLETHPFASNIGEIVYLTMNKKDGCLYYLRLEGELRKICYTGTTNTPPIAVITVEKNYSETDSLNTNFSAANSKDPEGDTLTYFWDFGNGQFSTDKNVNTTFFTSSLTSDKIVVKLTVTDQANLSNTDSIYIYLNNYPPHVHITSITDSSFYNIGESMYVDMIADVVDNDPDSELTYKWQPILFHEEHNHPEPIDEDHITYTTLSIDGCGAEVYWWEINLTVIDKDGLQGFDKVRLFPNCQLPKAKIISVDSSCKSAPINFVDDSYNAVGTTWNFEGGLPATSIEKNVSVTYAKAGLYKVTLIAQNILGADTVVKFVTIMNNKLNPVVTFSPNDSICFGDSIQVGVSGAGLSTSFQWYSGATQISGDTNATTFIKTTGKYKVLVSDNYGCSKFTTIQKLTFLKQPASTTVTGSTNIYAGDSVKIMVNQSGVGYTYQWLKNNVALLEGTTQIYYAKETGSYKCIITNDFGCSKTTGFVKVKVTSKSTNESIEELNMLTISPNPVVNSLNIKFNCEGNSMIYFVIIDALGREAMRTNPVNYYQGLQTVTINSDKLNSGIYVLQMKSKNNFRSVPFKVEKQK